MGIHTIKHCSEGVEFSSLLVDVFPVNLVSHNEDFIFHCELYYVLDGFFTENRASGVAWVYGADAFYFLTICLRFIVGILEFFRLELPAWLFVQVVRNNATPIESYGGRIERVLGDRDHDSIIFVADEHAHEHVDTLGSSFCEADIIDRRPLDFIFFLDKLGHWFADRSNSQGVGITASAHHWFQKPLCFFLHIFMNLFKFH